jgi:uncharacterized protein YbaP (TraB family)
MTRRLQFAAFGAIASAAVLAAATPAAADPTLWVAKAKGSTVYLIGTLHLLPPDVKWRTPAVEKALSDSSELWLEIKLPVGPGDAEEMKRTQQLVATTGMAPAGAPPLSSKLTADEWAKLQAVTAPAHVPPATLDRMQPWFASVVTAEVMAQSVGWSADSGVDTTLDREALAQGKPVKGFETPEQQLRMFGAMPADAQVGLLRSGLDDAGEAGKAKLARLAGDWAAGDDAAAAKHLVDGIRDKSPELYARMLVARNHAWIPQIEGMLKTPGVRMIAVGEGHLLGPDGVPALLKADGVRIERVR